MSQFHDVDKTHVPLTPFDAAHIVDVEIHNRVEKGAVRRPYSARRTRSLKRICNATANSFAISIPTLTFPNSIELM